MIKPGVTVKGIKPEILLALQEAREVYAKFGAPMVITSLVRTGGSKSLHRFGYAVDLRITGMPSDRWAAVAEAIRRALGPPYDVLLETAGAPHIHIAVQAGGFDELVTQLYIAGHTLNERDFIYRRAASRGGTIVAKLRPAPSIEKGALLAPFDIVLGG